MRSAMVLAGETRGGLTVTRALGELGIPVYVGSSNFLARSAYSKYCKKSFIYASPYADAPEKTHSDILHYVRKLKPDVLFPEGAETSYIVFKYADEYKKYCKVMPNIGFDKFRKFEDKSFQMKTAKKQGYRTPKTYFPKNINDVKAISREISYPALIKPLISSSGIGIKEVSNPKQLISEYSKTTVKKRNYRFDPKNPLIQELEKGQKFFVYGVFNKGKPVANMMMHVFRIYPRWGNPLLTVSAENEMLMKETISFMQKMKWHGPFCLQGAINKKDGRPRLFEINPRLGSHVGGAVAAGMNIPHILFRMSLGENVEEIKDYKSGRKFRHMQFGEFFYLLKSKRKFSLLREYISFKNTLADISLRDPLPNIIRFADLIVNKAVL